MWKYTGNDTFLHLGSVNTVNSLLLSITATHWNKTTIVVLVVYCKMFPVHGKIKAVSQWQLIIESVIRMQEDDLEISIKDAFLLVGASHCDPAGSAPPADHRSWPVFDWLHSQVQAGLCPGRQSVQRSGPLRRLPQPRGSQQPTGSTAEDGKWWRWGHWTPTVGFSGLESTGTCSQWRQQVPVCQSTDITFHVKSASTLVNHSLLSNFPQFCIVNKNEILPWCSNFRKKLKWLNTLPVLIRYFVIFTVNEFKIDTSKINELTAKTSQYTVKCYQDFTSVYTG